MKNYTILIFISIIFFGCFKYTPIDYYEKEMTTAQKNSEDDLKELVKKNWGYALPLDSLKKERLDENDAIISIKEVSSESSYSSYFQPYQIELDNDKEYEILIESYCDCLGFKKYIFIPKLVFLDSVGEQFKSYTSEPIEFDNISNRWKLIAKYKFIPLNNGKYYILVASNNEHLGQEIGETDLQIKVTGRSGSYNFLLDANSTLKGSFGIQITTSSVDK